ncbi:DUF3040 domain-containing protein [Lentzea sp. JNUCC 0626]|uniref:DUF3040 domain-containing protein n=1 Tax=Lentzea sp. JNUCC 0626 TaxID=3367513 RepID=UPI00374A8494
MALADREQRELEEIEQRLLDEDPALAAKLTRPSVLTFLFGSAVRALGVLAAFFAGLLVVVAGVTWSSAAVIALGALVCVGVFAKLFVGARQS